MKSSTNRALVAKNQSTFSAVMANSIKNLLQGYSKTIRLLLVMFLILTASTAWAETVTYTVSSTSEVTKSGTAPDGSSATYESTYSTKCQLTAGKSMTLTLSGYDGCKITDLTLSMKSNSSKGAGNMSMKIGNTTISSIATSNFNSDNWNSSWSTSYVDVTPSVTATTVGNGQSIVITIAATVNSLYCQSFTLTYTPSSGGGGSTKVDPTVTFSNGSYTIGGAALDLSTLWESNSAGAVTYSVTNAGTTGATVNGTSFTAIAAGTCTVQASQAATATHNAATETATITVSAPAGGGGGDEECTWELVTDASDLKDGDEVVIAAKDYNFAISITQNGNNRGQASITKNTSNNTITFGDDVQILTLEEGKTSGTLAFYTGNGYLYAASSGSNYMRTETTLSDNSSWEITIADDGTATIVAQGTNTRNTMQYNQSSSIFSCYNSASQKALVIYKKVCTASVTETVVTLARQGGTGGTPEVTATYGQPMPNITIPTRAGYTFNGYFDATSDGTKYYNTDGTSAKNWDKIAATTLYAQWTCGTPEFDIKIKNDNPVVFSGESIELTVVGSNIAADATYKWYKYNGATYDELAGETTNELTIAEATANDAGNYKCVVTNGTCSRENNYTVKMYHIKGLTDDAWTTPFEFEKSGDKEGTFTIELAATTTYYFKLNDGSVWYWNEGTMTHNNCTDWVIEQEGADTQGKENTGITTTASGTYTFTLNYEDPSKPKLSVTYPQKKMVYLNPGPWNVDNAKFAVHTWEGGNSEDIFMEKVDDCDPNRNIYQAEINASHTNITFVRVNPAISDISQLWNSGILWNQTSDLILPTDEKVMYDMTPLFLSPTAWNSDGAWFAAYFYGNGDTWRKMTDSDGNGIYECEKVSGYPNVIFCRMNPATTALSWDSKWNQSGNLTIPTAVNNHYTVPSDNAWNSPGDDGNWSNTGMWTTYTPNHTVTFDANDHDTAPEDQCITDGGKATQPTPAPTATGYTFGGWYTDQACNNAWDFENDVVTEDIILYAKWTANTHTVTWKPAGGNWSGDANDIVQEYKYGTPIEAPEKPTYDCYEFVEWEPTYNAEMTMPDEDLVFTAKWKFIPTLSWSASSCTAALEADNDYPVLTTNPADLTDITYSSLDESVATINENTGEITLKADGKTTITASFAGNGTYAPAADASYELNVLESNCRWVETEIGEIDSEDEVIVTMTDGTNTWALSNHKGTAAAPDAIKILVNGVEIYSPYFAPEVDMNSVELNNIIWNIDRDGDNLIFHPFTEPNKNLYCNTAENNNRVRVGSSNNAKITHKFIISGNHLQNSITNHYLGIYYSDGNAQDWRGYANSTQFAGQTLKFYKRECLDATKYWVTWDAGEGTWEDGSSKKLESYQVGAPITAPTENLTREGYRFDGWTPAPTTMPAQNTTFTAKWTEVYTITWYENSVPSYTYVPSDNPIVTWEDNIADCGTKKFYGWTADDTFVSDSTTPPTLISKGTTIAGDVTYYAVYADAEVPANPGYTKVTTISEGTYLIATDAETGKAYTGKSGDNPYGGHIDVTISNDVISEKPDAAVEVIVTLGTGTNAGKFAIYDGTYYLSAPSGNSITFNNNVVYDWNLTNDGYIHSNGQSTRYLQYNSSSPRFACYTGTQKYAYLYKKQTTTYKNFAVSCATYDISVIPTDGTVTTTPAGEVGAGQEITINVTPDDCKYLTALKYNDGSDDHSFNIPSTSYTFIMPAAAVTVTATFADKNATDIEILTSAHRMLMHRSAFVGEQVRITYNNGDIETLNWNDSRLTFTGYNTATLGSQTVTVTYNDCGTQSASYNIEVIDGLGITFWDGDYTETIKYEPGDLVDVDNKIGQSICDRWKFVGWSETKVANESNGFTPVHNFNATDAKVLYAVYVETSTDWISAYNIGELHPGAKYIIIAHYSDSKEYALTNTNNTNPSYLDGVNLSTDCEKVQEGDAYPYKYRYKLKVTPDENWKWQLENTGSGWTMRNISANKYLKVNSDKTISLTATPDDKFTLSDGSHDSEITAQSSSNNYLSWYNSSKYWNGHTSGQQYYLTNETNFTSTPQCSPLSATFHGNGGIVTDGIRSGDYLPIEEPTRDAGITTPTASFADCNGKSWTFVGWAREEIYVTRVPVLTTDLLHDGGGNQHYKIQEDGEEFWAVFTNIGNPETKYGTITFTDADVTKQYENAKTITKSVTAMGDYDFELYHVSNASDMGIQFDNDVTTKGYIKNITSLGKINSISLNDFQTGNIDDVKVYVGNTSDAINTLLTEADLQQTGNTYTYYPQKNYAYVKIEANGYCGITSISIDFGKGTQIWATTPDCSTITLSGDEIYITATNGRAIMASAPIAVKANQLEANANVILTSTSSDVYFSTDRTFNFAAGQAADQKPTTSLTLPTDAEGNLATTDVYIHYMPSSEGDGVPANVIISANLETPNPSITDDHTIHVRNLPAKFVIATKVGATWYALPADMTDDTNPLAEVIEVDEATMTATAPNTTTYTLWPVKTTNGTENRYADYGDRLRFAAVNYEQRGLWANNNNNSSAIKNYAVINSLGADGLAAYEWKVTTTVVDGHWQYTLQTDQTQNQNYLRYWTSAEGTPVGPKWGTYNAGENKLYFLPVTETQPFEYAVVEWYPTKMLIQTDAAITNPIVKIGGILVDNVTCTNKGGKLYEISNLPLETNPNEVLQVSFTADAVNYVNAKVVPIILSRGAKSITGEPFTTLTQKVYQYADVVVRDGATLTIDGGTDVANTLLGMTIYPTAKVSVAEGKKLSVHSLTFFGGIDEIYDGSAYTINKYGVPQLSLKGILNKTITNIDYIMRVDLEQMYSLTVPYDVQLADIKYWDGSDIALGSALYVSAYDGEARANQSKKTWIYETDFESRLGAATLKAGVGYTISAELQAGVGNEYSILRMPMMSNVASGATEAAKTVAVTAWGKDANVTDNHKGWNLVGNPYMTTIQGADDADLVLGYLKETGTGPWEWVDDGIRYVTIPSDDGTYYWQQKFTTAELPPFKNFFVQIGTTGELAFGLGTRQSMPARSTQAAIEKEVEFEILMSNDARQDNTGLLISEEYSPAYEINADLEKMIGSMSVYTIYGGYKLAYNALSPLNAEEQIPLGYAVPATGEYTFSLDERGDLDDIEHIYLLDHDMAITTDLMEDIYTFTATEKKNDQRFAISVILKAEEEIETPTHLETLEWESKHPYKFIYQDKMYILLNGVIYDAMGKQVQTINK